MSLVHSGLTVVRMVLLGLILFASNGLAHEPDYDHSKQPHEQPHSGHSSLAAAATNPIANLIQFQLQNQYNWENHNSSGYSNAFLIQPVVPIQLNSKKIPFLVTRTTVPFVSTPDLGPGVHRKHGLGDTTLLAVAIPDFGLKGQMIGLGISNVFPTAGDNDYTGNGKWLTGPSWTYFNMQTPGWQWGTLGWHHFTIGETSSGKDKKNVTETSLQPILVRHWGKGWYAGLQDVPWTYDHKEGEWSLPMGPKLGRVMKIGKKPVNIFGAVYYDPNSAGANAEWTAKINFTLLYPK